MSRRLQLAVASAALILCVSACNDDEFDNEAAAYKSANELALEGASDASWISLEGTVISKTPNAFLLDYGSGNVTVEMDDWDFFREPRHLLLGDRVSVTGRVDRDLLDRATIEASSVFVHSLGTYFYASGTDEEDISGSGTYRIAPTGSVDAVGLVTRIEGREFTIGTTAGSLRVDTSRMENNPLDEEGNPQVRLTDRVYVWGSLDIDPGESDELMAKGLIVLRPDRTKRVTQSATSEGGESNVSSGQTSSADGEEHNKGK